MYMRQKLTVEDVVLEITRLQCALVGIRIEFLPYADHIVFHMPDGSAYRCAAEGVHVERTFRAAVASLVPRN